MCCGGFVNFNKSVNIFFSDVYQTIAQHSPLIIGLPLKAPWGTTPIIFNGI